MKRIVFVLAVVAMVFAGCSGGNKSMISTENPQQQSFAAFLYKYDKLSYNQINDIQRKEFNQEFENQLENYLDTVKLFVNWRGKIDNIKVNEYGKSKEIAFEIKYEPAQYQEITFEVSYIVDNDSLSTDYIYNRVKSIANNSIVYFDGFIKRNKDNSIYYYLPSLYKMNTNYPHYNFNILDIDTQPKESLSSILLQCVNIIFQSIRQLPRYEKSEDVIYMESRGYNIVPNDNTVQLKRKEFVNILNENGYQNLYTQLSNRDKEYCALLLGYVISQWEFGKF